MTGKLSRTKGHQFERDIARQLRHVFPMAERNLEYQHGQGIDLKGTGKLRIQCKRGKQYAPITKIEEVPRGAGMPALVTRADNKEAVICLYLHDFLKIISDVAEAYE